MKVAGGKEQGWPAAARARRPPPARPPPPPLCPSCAPQPFHLKAFFSNRNVTAQIVRMADGHIVAAASTVEKAERDAAKAASASTSDAAAAARVGELLAARAAAAGLDGVHWARRRGERYHGKRKALVDAMRAAGLPLV